MRLIDTDKLIEKINLAIVLLELVHKDFNGDDEDEEIRIELQAYRDVRDVIINEPTIEPESKPWKWEPVSEKLPELDEDGYSEKLLLSFCNFPLPTIGEYRVSDGVGKWYDGDSDESVNAYALKVNAWMPLPKPYRGEDK